MTDGEISKVISELFDMTLHAIENRLGLRAPIYLETSTYGHFGRTPRRVTKEFGRSSSVGYITREVDLFNWEKFDYVDKIRACFGISV